MSPKSGPTQPNLPNIRLWHRILTRKCKLVPGPLTYVENETQRSISCFLVCPKDKVYVLGSSGEAYKQRIWVNALSVRSCGLARCSRTWCFYRESFSVVWQSPLHFAFVEWSTQTTGKRGVSWSKAFGNSEHRVPTKASQCFKKDLNCRGTVLRRCCKDDCFRFSSYQYKAS